MIAAIDGRAGLPGDKPALPTAAPRGPQFSHVLEHAHHEPARQAVPSRPAATQESQARAVTRRQGPGPDAATGRVPHAAEGQAAEGQAAQPASSGGDATSAAETARKSKSAQAGAAEADAADRDDKRRDAAETGPVLPDPTTVRAPAVAVLPTAAQIAGEPPRAGEVVAAVPSAPTLAQGYAPSGLDGGTLQAQMGLAAYRESPHGAGEPAAPEPAAPAHAGTALQNADPNAQPVQAGLHVVSASEMVQLSKAAYAAMAAGGEGAAQGASQEAAAPQDGARPLHADPNSAQARNRLLSQIGGPAGAPQPNGAPAVTPVQAEASAPGVTARGAGDRKEAKLESPARSAATGPAADAPPPHGAAMAGAATVGAAHAARDAQAAPDAGQQANPNLMDRIAEQSRWLLRSGHSEVTLKLQPEHLGEMRLKVVHKDGNLTVQMTVDSAATKHVVEAGLNDLRQRLQSENLAQGNLLLNVDIQHGSDSGAFAHLAQQAAQDGRAQGVNAHPLEQAAAAAPRPAVWGSSNLDIYA